MNWEKNNKVSEEGEARRMFTLRQLVEKKLEGQENMSLEYIDLEKAYDTCSSDRYGHGHVEVDGCPRAGGEDGRRHI